MSQSRFESPEGDETETKKEKRVKHENENILKAKNERSTNNEMYTYFHRSGKEIKVQNINGESYQ